MENITTFVAIDFETINGACAESACSVGLVKVVNSHVVAKHYTLISPLDDKHFNIHSMDVHKINPEAIKNGWKYSDVIQIIAMFMRGIPYLISYGKAPEACILECMKREFEATYGKPLNIPKPIDISCCFTGGLTKNCEKSGIVYRAHDALEDAWATAMLFLKYQGYETPELLPCCGCKKTGMDFIPSKGSHIGNVLFNETIVSDHLPLRGSVLQKDLEHANPDSMFYDKKVVVTGVFYQNGEKIDRNKLGDWLKTQGADIDTSITKKTNFVLVGQEPGPSKMKKIQSLQQEGVEIQILSQDKLESILEEMGVTL